MFLTFDIQFSISVFEYMGCHSAGSVIGALEKLLKKFIKDM